MRLKVLISAYACEPFKGSEPEVGWQWALQMARFHDVTVLTRVNNYENIQRGLAALPPETPHPRFIYFDESPWLLQIKSWVKMPQLYYIIWQKSAYHAIEELHRKAHFDLLHHVTIAGYRYTTAIWGHGVPCIWGPVGGMESIPSNLLPWRHPATLFFELLRNFNNTLQAMPFHVIPGRSRQSSAILVSTRETAHAFESLGVKIQIMPTIGIGRKFISDRLITEPKGPLKLLFVGSIIALKGVELAILALKQSNTYATLTFIGDGKYMKAAQALVKKLGLTSRVNFLGRKPRLEILDLYPNYDIFLFPSLHDSGAFAALEAMAQGLPVICLDCGGPAISVGVDCGIRVPLGKRRAVITGLASAIEFYNQNRSSVVQHGINARNCVLQNYEWNRKGNQMNQVYKKVVTESRKTSEPWEQRVFKNGYLGRHLFSIPGLTVILLIFTAVVGLQLWTMSELKRQANLIVTDSLPGVTYAGAANETRNQSFISLLLLVTKVNPEKAETYFHETEQLGKETAYFLERYRKAIHDSADQRNFDKAIANRNDYLAVRKKVKELVRNNHQEEALKLLESKLIPAFCAYDKSGQKLMEYNMNVGVKRSMEIMKMHQITEVALAIEGIAIFIIGFGLGFLKK